MAKTAKPKVDKVDEMTNNITSVDETISTETEMPLVEEVIVVEEKESDEILFLRNLLEIQENGGWGKNLHPIINSRISQLKGL
jgi:hypothetical protein